MLLSDVCLSHTSGIIRDQRGQVAHVTRDSDTTFKVRRTKVKVTGVDDILWRPPTYSLFDNHFGHYHSAWVYVWGPQTIVSAFLVFFFGGGDVDNS